MGSPLSRLRYASGTGLKDRRTKDSPGKAQQHPVVYREGAAWPLGGGLLWRRLPSCHLSRSRRPGFPPRLFMCVPTFVILVTPSRHRTGERGQQG